MGRSEISSTQYLNVCIRCPTECQLTHSDTPWMCRVSLRLTNATDGSSDVAQGKFSSGIPSQKSQTSLSASGGLKKPSLVRQCHQTTSFPKLRATSMSRTYLSLQIVWSDTSAVPTSLTSILLISQVCPLTLSCFHKPSILRTGLFVGDEDTEINLISDLAISYILGPGTVATSYCSRSPAKACSTGSLSTLPPNCQRSVFR